MPHPARPKGEILDRIALALQSAPPAPFSFEELRGVADVVSGRVESNPSPQILATWVP
jgi:hypothetical protein